MPKLITRVDECRALRNARVVNENIRVAESFAQVVHYTMDFWLMTLERELV